MVSQEVPLIGAIVVAARATLFLWFASILVTVFHCGWLLEFVTRSEAQWGFREDWDPAPC